MVLEGGGNLNLAVVGSTSSSDGRTAVPNGGS